MHIYPDYFFSLQFFLLLPYVLLPVESFLPPWLYALLPVFLPLLYVQLQASPLPPCVPPQASLLLLYALLPAVLLLISFSLLPPYVQLQVFPLLLYAPHLTSPQAICHMYYLSGKMRYRYP